MTFLCSESPLYTLPPGDCLLLRVFLPRIINRFINRDDLDFATIANMQPTQEWDLQEVNNGTLEYPTQ